MEVRRFKTDELQHHGILGMKWGIRRYQNKDGSLTAAGRKRYLGNIDRNKLDTSDYDKAFNKNAELSSMLLDKHNEDQTKRIEDAADTAMRALDRTDDYGIGNEKYYRDETEDTKKSVRFWMTYEDQTIGYVEIADLANQGKSSKEIRKILKEASKISDDLKESGRALVQQVKDEYLPSESKGYDYETNNYIENAVLKAIDNSESVWDLAEFNNEANCSEYFKNKHNRFIDACVEEASIKNKK